jgi:hypothetical protein
MACGNTRNAEEEREESRWNHAELHECGRTIHGRADSLQVDGASRGRWWGEFIVRRDDPSGLTMDGLRRILASR